MASPVKHSADIRLLPYRIAALFVFAEACGSNGLPVDVVD